MNWLKKKCVPCEGSVPQLERGKIDEWLGTLQGWSVRDRRLHKDFRFPDFKTTILFVNALADLAEAEGHHPDFLVHDWNQMEVTIWTHSIGGLSENDFILAGKIDAMHQGT